MTTAAEFANFTEKKLLGFKDFDLRLLRYVQNITTSITKRLFAQGSFGETMPLVGNGANGLRANLKPVAGDGFAHDGSGHLLDLSQIDRTAIFENSNGITYEVGAGYVEYPKGILLNPSNGRPEYECYVEGIGVSATPDLVQPTTTTITFRVNGLFESGTSMPSHAGRLVRVFRRIPSSLALTDVVAIETRTVFFAGGFNQITTAGLLGQATASLDATDYVVQLVGLRVSKDTASNKPSLVPGSFFFLGTVTGNSGTPSSFNITGQKIIQSQAASQITALALANWADGTTNPATDLQTMLAKIVMDLTSTAGVRGAGKITTAALANWADATTNPATTLAAALAKIVTDLTSTTGQRGAGKLTAPALANWADGTTNPAVTLGDALIKIVADLTSASGQYGAGKISMAAMASWADGAVNPASTLAVAVARIVADLTSVTATYGAGKITAAPFAGTPISITAGHVHNTLGTLHAALNAEILKADRRAEGIGVQSLFKTYDNLSFTLNDIAAFPGSNANTIGVIVVGGESSALSSRVPGGKWTSRSSAGSSAINAIACYPDTSTVVAVGANTEIQRSIDGIGATWSLRLSVGGGSSLLDVAVLASGVWCAIGVNGAIYTSPTATTWTAQTSPYGSESLAAIETNGTVFVVTTQTGKIMTSPTGATGSWTSRTSGTVAGGVYDVKGLQYHARENYFFATLVNGSGFVCSAISKDGGVNWVFSLVQQPIAETVRFALLDQQLVYLMSVSNTQPYSMHAVIYPDVYAQANPQAPGFSSTRAYAVYDICECLPIAAKNLFGTLYVVGRTNNGYGCVCAGAPFRPNAYNTI